MKDTNVGVLDIADYILFQLNKNHAFDYVQYFDLEKPYDDVFEFITDAAIKQNNYLSVSRRYAGNNTVILMNEYDKSFSKIIFR